MNNEFIEPRNAIKVIVAECQDPSNFWVTNLNLFEDPKQKEKYIKLENDLEDCQQLKLPCFDNHLIEVGELVAVKHPETNTWCRGKVCDIFQKQSKYFYKVFLVDRSYPIVCIRSNIRNLPHGFKNEPFLTYPIKLSSIIPRDFEERSYLTSFSSFWTQDAFNLVKKLISNGKVHYFVPQSNKHILCGDMYVQLEDKLVNIGDELCKAGLAFKNLTIFKTSLNLSESSEQIKTELSFSNNAQYELPDKDSVEEMGIGVHHEVDVTKKGLGRGKLMLLGNGSHETKPRLESNLANKSSELKVSSVKKHPLISVKNDFFNKQTSPHKISMGRGEHLKILQEFNQESRAKSNLFKNRASNLQDEPLNKADEVNVNLVSLVQAKLNCDEEQSSAVSFVPAGAESSVLQRIILKRNI